jgi:hypothetical protein
MSILSKKKQIFGNIAADRTITEGMPKLNETSSMPSINNGGNVVAFLTDLIKSLEGYESLVDTVIETLTNYLGIIEKEIKNALQLELKAIVSCGVNPSLPDYIKSTGAGIKFTVNKIDFTNLMKVDPNSTAGKLIYTDITQNLIDSKDFNTFLYQVIQNDGSAHGWGHQTSGGDILTFQFKSIDVSGIDPNNTLTIRADRNYDNKSLSDLNNDFINSLTLFDSATLLTKLVDDIFGSISKLANKAKSIIENDLKTNHIIDKITNLESNDILTDKFFEFTGIEKKQFEDSANLLKQGKAIYKTGTEFYATISTVSLTAATSSISGATSQIQKKEAIKQSINSFSDQIASASNSYQNLINNKDLSLAKIKNNITSFTKNKLDHKALKLNFIQQIIDGFTKVIVNVLLSPKVIAIFLINFKIIYGPNETFSDPVDFLKKNRNLVKNVVKRISGIIIKILLKKVLKRITQLIAESQIKKQIDKNQAKVTQLLSLLGIQQDVLRQIKGFI